MDKRAEIRLYILGNQSRRFILPKNLNKILAFLNLEMGYFLHYTSHVDYCKDLLYLTAVDGKGSGIAILAPLAEVTTLTGHAAERWQMLAAHVDSGHRLRQGLSVKHAGDPPATDLPQDAEAIFDVNSFRITEAVGHRVEPQRLQN